MKISKKDFDRRLYILNDILDDKGGLFAKYNDFLKTICHKLDEKEFVVLKSMSYGFKDKILNILAKSNRIKISYDKTLKYVDYDVIGHIFDDLDEEKSTL